MKRIILFGFLLIVLSSVAYAGDVTTALRAYWNFDNAYTNYTGGATYSPTSFTNVNYSTASAKIGTHALHSQGTTNNMTWGDEKFGITGDIFSVSFWTKLPTSNAMYYLITKEKSGSGAEWHVRTDTSGRFVWQNYNSGGSTVLSITGTKDYMDGNWHHVVLVKNVSTAYLYVDTAQQGIDTTANGASWNGTAKFYMFRRDGTSSSASPDTVYLDDIGIFKYALTAANRTYLYNSGTGNPIISTTTSTTTTTTTTTLNHCNYAGTGNWIIRQNCTITTSTKMTSCGGATDPCMLIVNGRNTVKIASGVTVK